MSYTYVNGIKEVTTDIHGGYKRFKSRNAQYRHSVDNDSMLEQWDFVSYAYPIMSVFHWIEVDCWEVFVTRDSLECSRTTTRQIVDFLKYIDCPITVNDIRMAINSGHSSKIINVSHDCVYIRKEVNYCFDVRF